MSECMQLGIFIGVFSIIGVGLLIWGICYIIDYVGDINKAIRYTHYYADHDSEIRRLDRRHTDFGADIRMLQDRVDGLIEYGKKKKE